MSTRIGNHDDFLVLLKGVNWARAGQYVAFADLNRRKVDICLVWALDRLAREGIIKVFELINKFKFYGFRVISHQES